MKNRTTHRNHLLLCMILLAVSLLFTGCAVLFEKPVQRFSAPLTLIDEDNVLSLLDDLDLPSLEAAIDRSLQYYERVPAGTYRFGNRQVSAGELKESLILFREIMQRPDAVEIKTKKIRESFEFYQAAGMDERGTMLFTGYYVPLLNGSPVMTERYRYPVYETPDDLIVVNLNEVNKKFKSGQRIGRLEEGDLVPYYSRRDIDEKGVLRGRHLEMVWVDDPFELFQLHVQGSGKIRLPDGQIITVSFAQSNGRPFKSISRFLLDHGRITGRDMAYQNIKNYLREHPDECAEIFNFNERYIFFQRVENGPMGALQLSVTSGRSIATDPDFFPKGALAFMKAQKPQLDPGGKVQAWVPFSRFVLNQDAGAAIKGPGRIDLFCGDGPEAEQLAGSLKEKGILYFLVKKKVKSSPIGNGLTNR